ncbi:MAG: HD domain-containing phosphohydrolase [Acidaminococcaceae bacterium]
MNEQNMLLQKALAKNIAASNDEDLALYALNQFGKEIDQKIQNELLTRLLMDYAVIARRIEDFNKQLAHSQEMLFEAQRIAMLGRWDFYRDSGELIWSDSMRDILEVDHNEPASVETFFTRVHPDDIVKVRVMHDKIFTIDTPWTMSYRLIMRDERVKWIELRLNPEVDSEGEVFHYYGTIQDITAMKTVEEELAKYNLQLETLVETKVQEISAAQMATIHALVKLAESRDDDTGTHIERTASFCRLLAQKAATVSFFAERINERFIDIIYKAAPLHDIGKVGISDSILLKPAKLTEEEFTIMKTHVLIGYKTLAEVNQQHEQNEFIKMGMDIARYHHEKWNGSGYLEGLAGEEIPLSARIMALADVYDALRSKRIYKEAFSHEKTCEIIQEGKGIHFDPGLVDIFLDSHEEFRELYDHLSGK